MTAVLISLAREPSSAVALAVLGLGVVAGVLLLVLRSQVRDTTMSGPWWWALASLVAVAGGGTLAALAPAAGEAKSVWSEPLQFAAAVSTFCPLMAQLGAKRPQNRAWGFIVLSLWAIVALPALESLALRRGAMMQVTDLRAWFLWALIVVGVANMLPTRHWLSALLVGAAQVCLLGQYLPLINELGGEKLFLPGLGLGAAAIACAAVAARRRRLCAEPWDAVWRDFRDLFGALWALRVAERVNADAAAQGWEVSLHWRGFRRRHASQPQLDLSAAEREQLSRTMNNLLRRFVTPQWIAARLGESVH